MGTLFDLHRKFKTVTLKDGDQEFTVALRSLGQEVQQQLFERLFDIRTVYEQEAQDTGAKGKIARAAVDSTPEALIRLILAIERPAVNQNADLAPEGETPEGQQTAIEKWEAERKTQLEAMPIDELRSTYVDNQFKLNVQSRVMAEYFRAQMVAVVVDPNSKQPLLSGDAKSPNYVGELMPETQRMLMEAVTEFVNEGSERSLRDKADAAPFSNSGKSRKRRGGSPGETTEILSTSLTPVSDSSTNASG